MRRRQFRVRNLLLAWSTYWLALIVVGLTPAIAAIWRMSQTEHGKGTVNGGVTDGIISASVAQNGVVTWTGSIPLLTLALLVALPPLVMWAIFLLTAPRTINAEKSTFGHEPAVAELKAGEPGFFRSSSSTSMRSSREES